VLAIKAPIRDWRHLTTELTTKTLLQKLIALYTVTN